MKTTKLTLAAVTAALGLATAAFADVQVGAELRISPRPRTDLEVYVWPDRGMDAVYYPGEEIRVHVELTRDAFLVLYNIDTRGRLHVLFPAAPWEDNFVAAGDVITFPRPWDDVDWVVEGPSGTEYIQAIASEIPISLPEWPIYEKHVSMPLHLTPHPDLRDFRAGADRYAYIDVVNRNLCGRYYDWCATDLATFHIQPRPNVYHINTWDPWPDVFYGQIYIGWPIGARIYIDGIFIGIAPCYIPRHYHGRRIITCYDGPRLIRRHVVHCYPKRDYYVHHRDKGIFNSVYKRGRGDFEDHFRVEKGGQGRQKYRVYDRDEIRVERGQKDRYRPDWDDRARTRDSKAKQDPRIWRDYDAGNAERKLKVGDNNAGKSEAKAKRDATRRIEAPVADGKKASAGGKRSGESGKGKSKFSLGKFLSGVGKAVISGEGGGDDGAVKSGGKGKSKSRGGVKSAERGLRTKDRK